MQGVATVVDRFVLDIEAVDIAAAAPAIAKADTVAAGPDTGAVDIAAAYVAAETTVGSALALPHAVPIVPAAFLKKQPGAYHSFHLQRTDRQSRLRKGQPMALGRKPAR